eukprot:scaffold652_cov260-Pinguiococcus_pyrenoidosus.AAC.2
MDAPVDEAGSLDRIRVDERGEKGLGRLANLRKRNMREADGILQGAVRNDRLLKALGTRRPLKALAFQAIPEHVRQGREDVLCETALMIVDGVLNGGRPLQVRAKSSLRDPREHGFQGLDKMGNCALAQELRVDRVPREDVAELFRLGNAPSPLQARPGRTAEGSDTGRRISDDSHDAFVLLVGFALDPGVHLYPEVQKRNHVALCERLPILLVLAQDGNGLSDVHLGV